MGNHPTGGTHKEEHTRHKKDTMKAPAAPSPQPEPRQPSIDDDVAARGRNLFVTLLDHRDEAAERKQADDRSSVVRSFRIPKRFTERYEWGELVGSGAYSYVQKAVEKATGQIVAIKCIKRDPYDVELCEQIEQEVDLQSEVCGHKNIVKIIEFVTTPGMYFIVMELLEGDLLQTIVRETKAGRYSERVAANTIKDLASALAACHSKNIAHLDIKPDNVLFARDGTLKLADFGMAAKVPLCRDTGTPLFVAPEILLDGRCDTKADIFSLGVVSYILLCGFAPFVQARTLADLGSCIKEGKWDFYSPFWDDISVDAKLLIGAMLHHDPRRRPTALQIVSHPWIVSASSLAIPAKVTKRIVSHQAHDFVRHASKVQGLRGMTTSAGRAASRSPDSAGEATTPTLANLLDKNAPPASPATRSATLRRKPAAAGGQAAGPTVTPRVVRRPGSNRGLKSALSGRAHRSSSGKVRFAAPPKGAGEGKSGGADDDSGSEENDVSKWERLRLHRERLVAERVAELDAASAELEAIF